MYLQHPLLRVIMTWTLWTPVAFGRPAYQLYWGDNHSHTTYSNDAVINTQEGPEGSYRFARDSAMLDFSAVTDHAGYVDGASQGEPPDVEWPDIVAQAGTFYEPGRFVTFIGFDREVSSKNFAEGYGDRAVLFRDSVVPPSIRPYTGISTAQLIAQLKEGGYEFMVDTHHPADEGGTTQRQADWGFTDSSVIRTVEIYSKHGSSDLEGTLDAYADTLVGNMGPFYHEGGVSYALSLWLDDHDPGYKLGLTAGTDDHAARPGSVEELRANLFSWTPVAGGLTAVYAPAKTREAIFDALAARRCYATTGPRIRVEFSASADADTVMMGETLSGLAPGTPVSLEVKATGDTEDIDSIQLFKNEALLETVTGESLVMEDIVEDWSFYRVKIYQKPTARAEGGVKPEMAWSSPIWVELGEAVALSPLHPLLSATGMKHAFTAFQPVVQVRYTVGESGRYQLTLRDTKGNAVREMELVHGEPGTYMQQVRGEGLKPGVYYSTVVSERRIP